MGPPLLAQRAKNTSSWAPGEMVRIRFGRIYQGKWFNYYFSNGQIFQRFWISCEVIRSKWNACSVSKVVWHSFVLLTGLKKGLLFQITIVIGAQVLIVLGKKLLMFRQKSNLSHWWRFHQTAPRKSLIRAILMRWLVSAPGLIQMEPQILIGTGIETQEGFNDP